MSKERAVSRRQFERGTEGVGLSAESAQEDLS